ncbi:MAG: c-type cytochrome [Gemmatimonadaceae bacterium]|nr:c-type cytochrome [Gemmatimonadaceae bacterium]
MAAQNRPWMWAAVVSIVLAAAVVVRLARPTLDAPSLGGAADTVQRTRAAEEGASGDAIRGFALLNNFRDSLPTHSGNRLRCTSCHLDNGSRPNAMPWLATTGRYPRYRERPGTEETLARRVNECIARSLAGKMLPEAGADMRDMLAAIGTLRDTPRPPDARVIKVSGDSEAGAGAYAAECARCHGAAGEGTTLAPAVWGIDSYSVGAGLARQYSLATFLRHNMPHDKPSSLSDQAAANIAAFVLSQPRQDHPGKERDWPNGDAPADVAYATQGATSKGRAAPLERPLLARRVNPDSTTSPR